MLEYKATSREEAPLHEGNAIVGDSEDTLIKTNSHGDVDRKPAYLFAGQLEHSTQNVESKTCLAFDESLADSERTISGGKRRSKYSLQNSKPKVHNKSNSEVREQQPAMSNLELIIERSSQLCSQWDGIILGTKAGAAALNRYFRQAPGFANDDIFHKYTGVQLAQMFETLHPKRCTLPHDSQVMTHVGEIIHREGFGVNDRKIDCSLSKNTAGDLAAPHQTLTKLFAPTYSQDNDIILKRRKIHQLDFDKIVNKLKQYENDACRLSHEEKKVLHQGEELGLLE